MFSRFLQLVVFCTVLFLSPLARGADDVKPLLVLALAPADEILNDLDHVTKLIAVEHFGKMARQVAGPFLGGIDRKRPAGSYLIVNGDQEHAVTFLPVTSFEAQLAILEEQLGKPEDVGGGVLKLMPLTNPLGEAAEEQLLYVKGQDGWAFLSNDPKSLEVLPKDPVALLEGLEKRYDLGCRIMYDSIPAEKRNEFFKRMRTQFESRFESQSKANSDIDPELVRSMFESFVELASSSKSLEFGLSIDVPKQVISAAFVIDALPNSQLDKSFRAARDLNTPHSGVLVRGSGYVMHRKARLTPGSIATWDKWMDLMLKDARESEPRQGIELTVEVQRAFLKLIERFAKATYADGEVDWGGSMLVTDGKLTWINGMHLVNAKALVADLQRLLEQIDKLGEGVTINWDAATHQGVRIIQITPKKDPPGYSLKLAGGERSTYVGIDNNYVYMTQGFEALKHLKQAIDRSRSAAPMKAAPLRVRVDAAVLAKLVASHAGEHSPAVEALLAKFDAQRQYAIRIQLASVETATAGLEGRLEIDEGVLAIAPELGKVAREWLSKEMAESQKQALESTLPD